VSDFSVDAGAMDAFASPSRVVERRPHALAREWSARVQSTAVRRAFLAESIESYTSGRMIRTLAGTWNTNGRAPRTDEDVREWIGRSCADGSAPDVVVVGFQEIVPLNVDKVLVGKDTAATEAWEEVLDRALNGSAAGTEITKRRGVLGDNARALDAWGHSDSLWTESTATATSGTSDWVSFDATAGSAVNFSPPRARGNGEPAYRPVAQKQLVGVYITVWVKSSLLTHVRDVRVASVATGFNIGVGVLGNKGACAVWLKIYSTPLVFVCSHLSAGTKAGDEIKRNEDFRAIVEQLKFMPPEGEDADEYTINDAESAIWMGDLNYRLNAPDHVVRSVLAQSKCAQLVASDQLNIERAAGRVFAGWHESELTFAPTYKYRPGTNIYSGDADVDPDDIDGVQKKEEEKKRTPAWTDRVLWRGDFDINILEYGRAELTHSDHKPVYAVFSILVRELEPQKLNKLLFDLRRRIDHDEMASQPKCTIPHPNVDLGEMRYAEDLFGHFTLSNVGEVPADFSIVSPIAGGPATPGWLSVAPMMGSLLPGEEIQISVRACVQGGHQSGPSAFSHNSLSTRMHVHSLIHFDAKPKSVDAVLVVRLENGRDFFVTVHGCYLPCAFGAPFEDLPSMMFPPNVPQVVGTLLDYLFEHLSSAPGIFAVPFDGVRTPGGVALISSALRQHASPNLSTLGVNVYDVGEALISLFSALPRRALESSEITSVVDAMPLDSYPSEELVQELLRSHLSVKTRAALLHTTTLIKRLDEENVRTGSSSNTIEAATTFARSFFPESAEEPSHQRVAFVCALAGCHPSLLEQLRAKAAVPAPNSIFSQSWSFFQSAPSQESPADPKSSNNLIDI